MYTSISPTTFSSTTTIINATSTTTTFDTTYNITAIGSCPIPSFTTTSQQFNTIGKNHFNSSSDHQKSVREIQEDQ
jgi:uncharacterized protein (DUF2225 family)